MKTKNRTVDIQLYTYRTNTLLSKAQKKRKKGVNDAARRDAREGRKNLVYIQHK